jgi:drug efflux transport system permease protein
VSDSPLSVGRLLAVATKEVRQVRRDPRMLVLVLCAPVIQLVLFGYAATFDLRDFPVVVVDEDGGPRAARLARAIDPVMGDGSELLRVGSSSRGQADQLLVRGQAKAVVVISRGAERVAVWVDGSDSNSATIARGALEQSLQQSVLPPGAPPVELRTRVLYNPSLRSQAFMVPGVIVILLLVTTTMLSALSIVKEKEGGTLEALGASALRPVELIAGKLLPFAVLGLLDVVLVLAVGTLWFRLPLRGSGALVLLFAAVFVLVSLGLGLLLSTLVRTQRQAMVVSFAALIPMLLLSGFIFPVDAMPLGFRGVSYVLPVRHLLEAVRAICLRGVGLEVLYPQLLILLGTGLLVLGAAVRRFRLQLA